MTDREIETLIGRAAAKTRRRAWSRHSSEVVTDLSDRSDGESVRFAEELEGEQDLDIKQAFPRHKDFLAKEILKSIAGKDLKNLESGITAQINTNQYNKMVSNAAVNKSLQNGFTRENHFEALANIEDIFQNAILLKRTGDLKNNDNNVKIYRFASPFVIDDEIADALLTVKESIGSDQRRVYSLELTEIKKLSEKGGTEPNSQYHTDSINKLQQKHEKIKSFLEKNTKKNTKKNTRFTVAPEETEWEKAVISVLRPVVGESVEMDKTEIAARVKELYGLDLSPDDANLYAHLAAAENRHDNASRQIAANKKRAFEHLEDNSSYFYFFRQSGENMVINPGKEYEGQEVSGSFISENFRKYSAITQLDDTGIAPLPLQKKSATPTGAALYLAITRSN